MNRLPGIASTILAAFPMAALIVTLFRFPVPFVGYVSGPTQIVPAMIAVAIYGVIGGFLLLGALGYLIAGIPERLGLSGASAKLALLPLAAAIDLPPLLLLATLDWLIGPW